MRKLNGKRLAAVVLAVLLVFTGVYWVAANVIIPYLFPDWLSDSDDPDSVVKGRMNLLVLGVDSREGEKMARSDTILFVSADPEKQRVALLSIPRDTRVEIPGYGTDKINAATALGGPELAERTVTELIGQPIDYYMVTDFQGFERIVDILGGVTIDVEQDMRHHESDGYSINLQKGVQRLDGKKALMYVRYRDYPMGDITRTEIQQKFLKALAQEMMQTKTIAKLPKLVPELRKCIQTNMSVREMARWAGVARQMEGLEMVSATLPGYPAEIKGGSYWYVDPALAKDVAARLVNGEQVADINPPPPPSTVAPAAPKETVKEPEPPASEQHPGNEPAPPPADQVPVIIVPDDGSQSQEPPPSGGGPAGGGGQTGNGGGIPDWGTLPPVGN